MFPLFLIGKILSKTKLARKEAAMSEENKAIVRRFMEEQDESKGQAEELYAPGFIAHVPGSPSIDLKALKEMAGGFYSAFPNLTHVVEDLVAEGDKVAIRATSTATHDGPLMDISPSHKEVSSSGMVIFRIVDGKIAEMWSIFDQMGLMQQIGAIPSPAQV